MTPPRLLLAIECSSESASVALLRPEAEPLMRSLAGGAAVSSALLNTIAELLQRAGLHRRSLDAIAFGAGPGAFMGVRTAAAVAQGLAVARDLPVQPVGTLEALAWHASDRGRRFGRIAVVIDARMGEVYHAVYECDGAGALVTHVAPAVDAPAVALATWRDAGVDDATHVTGAPDCLALDAAQPRSAVTLDASHVGHFALDRWAGGDAALAVPVYVRDRVAATLVERGLARAAA